ncbi:MAG: hypothetical protein P9L91_10440, partial [Candidatus Zophobacter franzmannii]|nr:hypothetical protein [Candidatus Zophobacter franzmannii]
GLIDGNFVVTGALNSPELYGEVRADVLTWNNQSVSDLKTKIILNSNDIEIELDKAVYLGNEISGKGTFSDFADLNLRLSVQPSEDEEQAIDISSKIEASLHFDNKVTGIVLFNDTGYIDGDKNFNGLSGYVDIRRDSLEFKLEQSDDMFSAEGKLNILTMDGSADVDFKNIILNDYYQNSDIGFLSSINLNGRTSVILENNKLFGDISLRIVDVANILYDSRIKADVQYDFKNYRGELSAQTKSSLFNDRPFSAELEVSSYRDSIIVRNLSINDQLSISGWMNIMDGFTYGFKVRGEDIDIKDVLKYELTTYQMNQFTGVVDLDIDINSRNDKKAEGVVQVENFSLGVVKPISARATISGSNEYIDLDNVFLDSTISDELLVNGFVDLRNGITFNAGATFTDLEVSEVLSTDIKGLVSGKCEIEFASSQTNKPTLSAVVSSSKLDAYGFRLNRVHADASQYADSLVFNELILVSKKKLDLDLQGALGYNILNGETSVVNNTLNVTLNSDIAQILKSLKLAEKGDVPMELKAELTMSEDGLSFENGSFKIKDGRVNVETQLQELSSINVDISILDNEVDFKRFDLRSGASKLYIRNEIANDEKDLILGLLRIGKLYVKTGKTGIHVSVPQYSQENSLTNAIIKGRNTNEAVIEGPFDDLHIEADVILRNAMALYPPKVDNLLKLFSQLNPLIKRKEIAIPPILPFKMDVVLYFDENSRYITYPANIPVKENSFVHLIYNGEIWEVKQILINADSGTFDFFGINFKVDFFEVGINEYSGEYLLGELYHKTSEGTTIFLSIDTDDDLTKSFADRLIFNITSDNPNDYTTMNILARLRYDSDLADLSSEQQGAIWQDQALNLLEGNLNSYYLDPILFPVENSIRKFFKLDFLYVDFGFLQNVYSNYVINEKDAIKREESELVEFSSSILLDNLKINAGKYLTRNIYLDYTALFQETTDLETKTNIIVHHDTTFRVNLPYKFKVSYSFGIKPDEDEIYSHEVMLQRSIRFDFNNYKYHRKNRRRYAIQPIN